MPYDSLFDYVFKQGVANRANQQQLQQQQDFAKQQNDTNRNSLTAYEQAELNRQGRQDAAAEQDRQFTNFGRLAKLQSDGLIKETDANRNDIDADATTPAPAAPAPTSQPFSFAQAGQAQPQPTGPLAQPSGASPAFSALFGQGSQGNVPPTGASASNSQAGALGAASVGSTSPSQTAGGQTGSDSGPKSTTSTATPSTNLTGAKPDFSTPDGRHFRFTTQDEQVAHSASIAKQTAAAELKQKQDEFANAVAAMPNDYKKQHGDDIAALSFKNATGLTIPDDTEAKVKGNIVKNLLQKYQSGDLEGAKPYEDLLTKIGQADHPSSTIGNTLTPEAIDQAAERYYSSGVLPPAGMGAAGQAVRNQILNRVGVLHPGAQIAVNAGDYAANKASLTALQKNSDSVEQFERTAGDNINLYLSQMGKVVDSNSPWINKPLREVDEKLLGNADLPALSAARQVANTEIARVTSNPGLSGQLTDSARHEVEAFNPATATLKQAYEVMKVLKSDMDNRRLESQAQLTEARRRLGAGADQQGSQLQGQTPGTTGPDGTPTGPITPKTATPPTPPPSLPRPLVKGQKLDPATASKILQLFGGNKAAARAAATNEGWGL